MRNAKRTSSLVRREGFSNNVAPSLSRYPGSKATNGAFRQIINLIPPHDCYIETHLGAGAVFRNKRAAKISVGIDADLGVIQFWENQSESLHLVHGDACRFLRNYPFQGGEFVYSDPPYLISTRRSQRRIYRHEYSVGQHQELLEVLKNLPCYVMISGFSSNLYARELKSWNTHAYKVKTQTGIIEEWLWFNYQKPQILHDFRYLGRDFRERERIRRKAARWTKRVLQLEATEKKALLSAIAELTSSPSTALAERQMELPFEKTSLVPLGKGAPRWRVRFTELPRNCQEP